MCMVGDIGHQWSRHDFPAIEQQTLHFTVTNAEKCFMREIETVCIEEMHQNVGSWSCIAAGPSRAGQPMSRPILFASTVLMKICGAYTSHPLIPNVWEEPCTAMGGRMRGKSIRSRRRHQSCKNKKRTQVEAALFRRMHRACKVRLEEKLPSSNAPIKKASRSSYTLHTRPRFLDCFLRMTARHLDIYSSNRYELKHFRRWDGQPVVPFHSKTYESTAELMVYPTRVSYTHGYYQEFTNTLLQRHVGQQGTRRQPQSQMQTERDNAYICRG